MSNKKASVHLRPMTDSEYAQWLPEQTREYAASKVKSGNWPKEKALELATQQMQELLPKGPATPGHRIWVIEDERTKTSAGVLWVNVKESNRGREAFIYNIEVPESMRGGGYGTAALAELEKVMKREGVTALLLHVFGYNTGARRLYERCGYEITNVNMAKKL